MSHSNVGAVEGGSVFRVSRPKEMAAFDLLPAALRDFLNACPVEFLAASALQRYRQYLKTKAERRAIEQTIADIRAFVITAAGLPRNYDFTYRPPPRPMKERASWQRSLRRLPPALQPLPAAMTTTAPKATPTR